MATSTVLVATWRDGLIAIADGNSVHELKGQPVRGLTSDGEDGAFAVLAGTHFASAALRATGARSQLAKPTSHAS